MASKEEILDILSQLGCDNIDYYFNELPQYTFFTRINQMKNAEITTIPPAFFLTLPKETIKKLKDSVFLNMNKKQLACCHFSHFAHEFTIELLIKMQKKFQKETASVKSLYYDRVSGFTIVEEPPISQTLEDAIARKVNRFPNELAEACVTNIISIEAVNYLFSFKRFAINNLIKNKEIYLVPGHEEYIDYQSLADYVIKTRKAAAYNKIKGFKEIHRLYTLDEIATITGKSKNSLNANVFSKKLITYYDTAGIRKTTINDMYLADFYQKNW